MDKMREIKFKYVFKHYDTNKIMYYILNLNMLESKSGRNIIQKDLNAFESNGLLLIDKLQYTGLKDKNETDIYTDDFVKANQKIYQIIFWQNMAGFMMLHDGLYESMLYISDWAHRVEIIGNKYENPELLANSIKEK